MCCGGSSPVRTVRRQLSTGLSPISWMDGPRGICQDCDIGPAGVIVKVQNYLQIKNPPSDAMPANFGGGDTLWNGQLNNNDNAGGCSFDIPTGAYGQPPWPVLGGVQIYPLRTSVTGVINSLGNYVWEFQLYYRRNDGNFMPWGVWSKPTFNNFGNGGAVQHCGDFCGLYSIDNQFVWSNGGQWWNPAHGPFPQPGVIEIVKV